MLTSIKPELKIFLAHLIQREGMNLDRIRSSEHMGELQKNEFFIRLFNVLKTSPEESIKNFILAGIQDLESLDRLCADAALGVKGEWSQYSEEKDPQLMTRRRCAIEALTNNRNFHVSKSPSNTTYRDKYEKIALEHLLEILNGPNDSFFQRLGLSSDQFSDIIQSDTRKYCELAPQVVVIGAAVMDVNFMVSSMPEIGGSVQALRFEMHPGGKALTQAIACARLGMKTSLISVVGKDLLSEQILNYLQSEGVSVDLVHQVEDAGAAVTGVFTKANGLSMAIGWKNENLLRLPPSYIEEKCTTKLRNCDYLLSSFELPPTIVEKALSIAKEGNAITIVTPAPPYDTVILDIAHRRHIDYLVANSWEAHRLVQKESPLPQSPDDEHVALARELLCDISNVVIASEGYTFAYRSKPGEHSSESPTPFLFSGNYFTYKESAGARDAFCAMLAKKLHEFGDATDSWEEAMRWATAAMSCVAPGTAVPRSMPRHKDVEVKVKQTTLSVDQTNIIK